MRFRLGYVAEPLVGHEKYEGRLCIPYLTRAGVTTLKFRRLGDGDGAKYLFHEGTTGIRLFNPEALFDERDYICITEGELDAIAAEQCGIPAVGVPGVDNWRPFFARCFSGYERVLILADNDDKEEQGKNFAKQLSKLILNSRVILMPRGHDVNSFLVAEGADALRKKVGID